MGINTDEAIASHFATYGDLTGMWNPTASVASDAWTPYDQGWVVAASSPAVTLTKSIEADAGSGINLMKVTASASGTDAHREFLLRSDKAYVHSEVRSVIYGHGTWTDAAGLTQQGHVHAAQRFSGGRVSAFVAWHDAFIGLPTIVNVGLWSGGESLPLYLHNTNKTFVLSSPPRLPVTHSSRAGGVVTIQVPGRHDIDVNSHLDVTLPVGDLGATNATVTGVSGGAITYADAGADSTNGGGGLVQKHTSTNPYGPLSAFPFVMVSRLISGGTLQAKIYRLGDLEPPWSDAVTYVAGQHVSGVTYEPSYTPSGPGLTGLLAAHVSNSESVRFGNPQIRQLSI